MTDTEALDVVPRLEATAHLALPRFGIAPTAPLALIHHRENAVFRIDDPADGRRWVMRVHRLGYGNSCGSGSDVGRLLRLCGRRRGVAGTGAQLDDRYRALCALPVAHERRVDRDQFRPGGLGFYVAKRTSLIRLPPTAGRRLHIGVGEQIQIPAGQNTATGEGGGNEETVSVPGIEERC